MDAIKAATSLAHHQSFLSSVHFFSRRLTFSQYTPYIGYSPPFFTFSLHIMPLLRLRSLILALFVTSIASTNAIVLPKRQAAPTIPALPPATGQEYRGLTCTANITDLGLSPISRWQAALADEALTFINLHWNEQLGAGGTQVSLTYVNSIMNLLGQGEQNCGLEIDSCDFSSLACTNVDNPGDWLVLKSLSNFHKVRYSSTFIDKLLTWPYSSTSTSLRPWVMPRIT
jgi:hypothetical protein